MKHSSRKGQSIKRLLIVVVVMSLVFVFSAQTLQAFTIVTVPKITINPTLIILPKAGVSIGTITETSVLVIGSTNVDEPDGRYIRLRVKGNPWSMSYIVPDGFKFSRKYSGLTPGETYEAQAYIKLGSTYYYSDVVEVVPRSDPEFIVTTTPDHDLVDEDLLIGFTLDIDPHGHTISDVSISISGPGLSSGSSGLSVPVNQKYTSIQGNSVYTVDFECVTNFGTYSHQVVYNTTLTATPTPTQGATTAAPATTAPPETTQAAQTTVAETSMTESGSETDMDMTTESGSETGQVVAGNDEDNKNGGFFSSDNLTMLIIIGVIILLLIAVIAILLIVRSKPKMPGPPQEPPME